VLRSRFLAALVLVPPVVWILAWAPPPVFALFCALVLLGGAWEWGRLVPLRGPAGRGFLVLLLALGLGLLWRFPPPAGWRLPLGLAAALSWGLVLLWEGRPEAGRGWSWLKFGLGLWLPLLAWWSLVTLRAGTDGPWRVTILFLLVWVADSGAYFSGRLFGRRRLAPRISPGKTWEGVLGELLLAALAALLLAAPAGLGTHPAAFVVLVLVSIGWSIVGDLFISLLKRQQGLKDTGRLIPGHGGILDRIDSLLAAAPWFLLGLHWVDR